MKTVQNGHDHHLCWSNEKKEPSRSDSDTTRRINWLLRLAVGGAFVLAGALKIADPAKFAVDVGNYRLLPHELNNLVAILIPWIEVAAGVFVLAGIWLRPAALVISSLTVMFFFVILSALARGLNMDCGCFGTVGGQHVGLVNLAIDSTLFFLAANLFIRSPAGPQDTLFREAGAQVSASPNEASTKASSAS
ncbi:MAG: Methylamine utilization protein MauE [Verrucomicrobia bacterium]|nr:Methylamine utilization protein MauE [Verrucomicrobiota bacterium]